MSEDTFFFLIYPFKIASNGFPLKFSQFTSISFQTSDRFWSTNLGILDLMSSPLNCYGLFLRFWLIFFFPCVSWFKTKAKFSLRDAWSTSWWLPSHRHLPVFYQFWCSAVQGYCPSCKCGSFILLPLAPSQRLLSVWWRHSGQRRLIASCARAAWPGCWRTGELQGRWGKWVFIHTPPLQEREQKQEPGVYLWDEPAVAAIEKKRKWCMNWAGVQRCQTDEDSALECDITHLSG